MRQVRTTHFVNVLVAGAAMLLALSGCATASPSATSSRAASESAAASPTPVEPTAATWTTTGHMLEARTRYQTATLLLDGRVLVAGGEGASGGLISAEVYDPSSGSWAATGSMTMERYGQTATLLRSGKVLVVGGMGPGPSYSQIEAAEHSAELYDPVSGSWSATGSMNVKFSEHTATLMADGQVLIAGGGSAALYDPNKGTWRATGQMIEQRYYHTATLLPDGRVLIAGGGCCVADHSLASAEVYDPVSGTWSAAGDMITSRMYHAALLLPDGNVLVTGGWAVENESLEAPAVDELYDPATGTWTATGNMDVIRGGGSTDTPLPDGTVLAAGGLVFGEKPLASAELYDTSSGTWTATVTMHQARTYQTATLLLDGTVLVAGGCGSTGGDTALSSAELYDPGSGS